MSGHSRHVPPADYVSPGLEVLRLDDAFPHMVVGDRAGCRWPYLRREVPHNWYVDARYPRCGFLSRDEAHVVFNNGLAFRARRALEIGCWKGWSTCHLLAAGVHLDVIDPVLARPEFRDDVTRAAALVSSDLRIEARLNLRAEASPDAVERLACDGGARWSLVFIDGGHDAPAPLHDAMIAARFAADDALILLHDVVCPDVASGLAYLRSQGWQTALYQTAQMIGAAWRGNARPVPHQPDPRVAWSVPDHLLSFDLVSSPGAGG
jgi:predicted O-methyltransferase YrrM